jgi:hypothetical protein
MTALGRTLAAIDAANAHDPRRIEVDGRSVPAALIYGQRMTAQLAEFEPTAGIALQIAARGQHIERWTIPRASFPEGRIGYLSWRKELQRCHARRLSQIMGESGFDAAIAERVGQIVRKERLAQDPEVQTLEDVACLVFLTHELAPFAAGQDDDKLARILAKTWRKMSNRAHRAVMASPPPQHISDLLAAGLAALTPDA